MGAIETKYEVMCEALSQVEADEWLLLKQKEELLEEMLSPIEREMSVTEIALYFEVNEITIKRALSSALLRIRAREERKGDGNMQALLLPDEWVSDELREVVAMFVENHDNYGSITGEEL